MTENYFTIENEVGSYSYRVNSRERVEHSGSASDRPLYGQWERQPWEGKKPLYGSWQGLEEVL